MGNQEIKRQLSQVLKTDFESNDDLQDSYWSFAFRGANLLQCQTFLSLVGSTGLSPSDEQFLSKKMQDCFPNHSTINFNTNITNESRWDLLAKELWQSGYTSWRHNLVAINGSGYKDVVMTQNRSTAEFEFEFYSRCLMFCSNFMLRHQSGSEIKDIEVYFREQFDHGTAEYAFTTTAQTAFVAILSSLADTKITQIEAVIDALLMSTKGIEIGALFSVDKTGMQLDLLLRRIRQIIDNIIRGNSGHGLKTKCVELLMRIGTLTTSPEDLIMAAQYQFEFKIDILSYLEYFAGQSEVYADPKSGEENAKSLKLSDKKRIQDKCDYEGHGDNRQHSHDKLATDGASYFTYSESRGLTRANRKSDNNEWKWAAVNQSDKVKDLQSVTFLVHQGDLYIRHSKVEKGLLPINKQEMTIQDSDPIELADDAKSGRFSWTTDENAVVEDRGKRWMLCAPMASDGTYIYTIVEWRKDGKTSDRVATMLETYEFVDKKLKFLKEVMLLDKENKPWFGKQSQTYEKGGYFDHGSMACNGVNMVWHSKKNVHVFDVVTGNRVKKENRHSKAHLSCFESNSSNWYSCDADVYSWLQEWSIKGFKTKVSTEKKEEKEAKLPEVPIILDSAKAEIKEQIIKTSSPTYELNLFSQLIGGEMEVTVEAETQASYKQARQTAAEERKQKLMENPPKRDLTEQNWLYDYTRAIILSYVSKEAQTKNFFARSMGNKQLDGKKMLDYFKSKWGIYVSQSTFKQLRLALTEVLDHYIMEQAHITQRSTLKSLLHIYIAHIGCLRPLKISIRQFMSVDEMKAQEELIKRLDQEVQIFTDIDISNGVPQDAELSEDRLFQLHIYYLSKQVYNEMSDLISTKTVQQKLEELQQALQQFKGQTESSEVIRLLKLYPASEFSSVFNQDQVCLEKMMQIFGLANELVEERVLKDDFGEATHDLAQFSFNFVRELLAKYGNHVKAILDNATPEKPDEEENKAKEKRIKALKFATERKAAMNYYVYESMIKASQGLNSLLRKVSTMLIVRVAHHTKQFFQDLEDLLIGHISLLRSVLMFTMTTQLFEVGGNDLDECAIALRAATQGISYYIANNETLSIQYPFSKSLNEKIVEELVASNRFIATGLNKVSARFVRDHYRDNQTSSLCKYKVFEHGIAQNYIPLLSKECKDGIEGSFKLIEDEKLRQLCMSPAENVQHNSSQQLIQSIANKGDQALDRMLDFLNEEEGMPVEVDEQVETLVRHTFAAFLLFSDKVEVLERVREQLQNDQTEYPQTLEGEKIQEIFRKACEIRGWKNIKTREVRDELKTKLIDEYRKEYKDKNPSAKPLPSKLAAEHTAIIEERLAVQTYEKVKGALTDTIEKCKLLLWFDTSSSEIKINVEGVHEENNSAKWNNWNVHVSSGRNAIKENAETESERAELAQQQVLEVIQASITSEAVRSFIEDGQVKGLRRMAGIQMFNQSMSFESNDLFYDTLHFWRASLRGNKANLCDYLSGVEGCGGITAGKIRKEFFKSLRLIIQKIKVEQDDAHLVQLLDALLWDYNNADLEILAKEDIFDVLAGAKGHFGDYKWNKLYTSWGKETSNYSLQNSDDTVQSMKHREYSLSARLRQAFDFLANKLLSIIFKLDGSYHNNIPLKKVGDYLVHQLFNVCNQKMDQHLEMLNLDPLGAAQRRDQEIRVDNASGEEKDDPEVKLWDEHTNGTPKVEQTMQKKMVDEYIFRLQTGTENIQGINGEISQKFSDFQSDEVIKDAIVTRNWRICAYLEKNVELLNIQLEAEAAKEEERAPSVQQTDAVGDLHSAVEGLANDKSKIETYLTKLQEAEIEGKDISKVRFFTQNALAGFLKFYQLIFSLLESSTKTADIPKKLLTEQAIATLVGISVSASAPIQCLTQRIFQNMLRTKIPLTNLNASVEIASKKFARVSQIKDYSDIRIRFDSDFWQFLYNQIYLTTEAQMTNALSVEVGKAVVVEEIIRTFYVVLKDPEMEFSQSIRKKIINSLILIDRRNSIEISTLFKLVPEAHQPVISTGSRCFDQESKESLIVLGFANLTDVSKNYQSKLSMVQVPKADVIGLSFSKGRISKQQQKKYKLQYLTPTPLAQAHEDFDLTEEEKNLKIQEITKKTSIFMNPEIIAKLFGRIFNKDQYIRSTGLTMQQYSLQENMQRGILKMLEIFQKEYLIELKSFSQLEPLIEFLQKEAALQQIKEDEPLVSSELLTVLTSEVKNAASFRNRSAGQYGQLLMYMDEKNSKSAILQRISDENLGSEFFNFDIEYTVNDMKSGDKRLYGCDTGHIHSSFDNYYNNKVQLEESSNVKCKKCDLSIASINKIAQQRSGMIKCIDCTSDFLLCNQCAPKPVYKEDEAFEVSLYKANAFRMARSEVVFMHSKDLKTLSDHVMGTLLGSNVVVIDSTNPLLPIMSSLANKVMADKRYQPCAQVRFVVISDKAFKGAASFLNEEPMPSEENKGTLITKMYKKVEIVQKKIQDNQKALRFITEFLVDQGQDYNEYVTQTVPQILKKFIAEDFQAEEGKEREREERKMLDQLSNLDREATHVVSSDVTYRSNARLLKVNDKTTPDFMSKFTAENQKLVEENGERYFYKLGSSGKDESEAFQEIVFETALNSRSNLSRKQLHSSLLKINQLIARSILLKILSEAENVDSETQKFITSSSMHIKICDLIHQSNMAASHQRIFFCDKQSQEVVRDQISSLLKFFDVSQVGGKFRIFYIKDFLKRADQTIEQVKKDDYQELESYKQKDLRKVSKLPNVLDPSNLMFLSNQLFELEHYIPSSQRAEMAKIIFDLHLGFAIIFKSEQDQDVCHMLLKGCAKFLDHILEDIDSFVKNPSQVDSLLTGEMIQGLFKHYIISESESDFSKRQQLLTELIFRLNKIFMLVRVKIPENAPAKTPFINSDSISKLITAYSNIEHGQKFTSLMARIKLLALLYSPHKDLVQRYGQSYFTDKKMYKTYFKKNFKARSNLLVSLDESSSTDFMRILRESDQESLSIDSDSMKSGAENQMRFKEGEDISIEFPVQLNQVKWSGKLNNRDCGPQRHEDYTNIDGLAAVEVHARHNHAMFVTESGAIYGIGYRAQGREATDGKLRQIQKPDNCKDYLKVTTGKFFRLIVTKDHRLFFSGQNKKNMVGKDVEIDTWKQEFTEIKNFYPMEDDEGVLDVAGGKHFMIVLSTKNKLYGSGFQFYRACSDVRSNERNDEDLPFKLASPEGWKPLKVWANDRYVNAWITCQNIQDPTKFKTFSIGSDYDMIGACDSNGRSNWVGIGIPEGVYLEKISSQGMSAYGTDNEGNIWEWGDHRISNQGETLFFDKHGSGEGRSTPYRLIWFKENKKEILQVESGASWAMFKVRDTKSGRIEMYGIGESLSDNRCGQNMTEVYSRNFMKLPDSLNFADCVDFSLTREASFLVIQKKCEFLPSIVEEDESYRGLVHFYKDRTRGWVFVKEDKLSTEKMAFNEIVFATRHPIKDFKTKKDDPNFLPDLRALQLDTSAKNKAFAKQSSLTGKAINRERLYYAKYLVNGCVQEVYLTQEDVLQGGQFFDMQPIVFYALSSPVIEFSKLPMLDQDKLFHRATSEDEQIQLSITESDVEQHDILNIPYPTKEFALQMRKIRDFNRDQDLELIRAIDSMREENFKSSKMQDLKANQFDPNQFKLAANSTLEALDSQLLRNRIKLIVGFSAATSALLPLTFHEKKPSEGQLSAIIKENKIVVLPSIKKKLFMDKVSAYWDERGTKMQTDFNYNRQLAADFQESAVKNDPRFITDSTFGQMFTQLQLRDSEFTMMQNQYNSFDIRFLNRQEDAKKEANEAAFAFRHMELDLMSDRLPLFIRTPNGRHRAGQKRDCFLLNPRMTTPDWFKCYQFIGALIGRIIFKEHLFFGVPMAPTFWMLSNDEQPRLEDFAHEDARLAQRLAQFEQEEFFEDDTWVWINSEDQVVPIEEDDPEKPVTRENLADFKQALLEKLTNECQVQMSFLKKGISHALGDADHFRDYINWHDTMELGEKKKLKDYNNIDVLKEATVYKDIDADSDLIKRFWTVYGKLNRENKKLFFNFTGGRSHVTDVAHRFEKKLTIRVDASIPANSKPKSLPNQFELLLPESYESEEKFTSCLLEALAEGIGLESDPM